MPYRTFVWICLVSLLALSPTVVLGRDQWLYVRSANFEMLSSASEARSRRTLMQLEQFRAFFMRTFALKAAPEPRCVIVLFGSESGFEPYKPRKDDGVTSVAGYMLPGVEQATLVATTDLDRRAIDSPAEVMLHEYVHLTLHSREKAPPLWLNEGLADFYSTFDLEEERVVLGRTIDNHVRWLASSALVPFANMVAAKKSSPEYNDATTRPVFYAQSWAFVHYLFCGNATDGAKKLGKYLALIEDAPADRASAAFEQAFGMSYREMELAVRDYIQNGQYQLREFSLPLKIAESSITIRPATGLERDVALLDLRSRLHHSDAELPEALRLAAQYNASPRPHELLAWIHMAHDRDKEALESLERAAARHSENPHVYTALAAYLCDHELGKENRVKLMSQPASDRVRELLDRALEVSPTSALALELLSFAESASPNIRVASLNRVQKAAPMLENPTGLLYGVAVMRWRLGDAQSAAEIVDFILADKHTRRDIKEATEDLRGKLSKKPAEVFHPAGRP